jgi:hypothetical protein
MLVQTKVEFSTIRWKFSTLDWEIIKKFQKIMAITT